MKKKLMHSFDLTLLLVVIPILAGVVGFIIGTHAADYFR